MARQFLEVVRSVGLNSEISKFQLRMCPGKLERTVAGLRAAVFFNQPDHTFSRFRSNGDKGQLHSLGWL